MWGASQHCELWTTVVSILQMYMMRPENVLWPTRFNCDSAGPASPALHPLSCPRVIVPLPVPPTSCPLLTPGPSHGADEGHWALGGAVCPRNSLFSLRLRQEEEPPCRPLPHLRTKHMPVPSLNSYCVLGTWKTEAGDSAMARGTDSGPEGWDLQWDRLSKRPERKPGSGGGESCAPTILLGQNPLLSS